MHILVDMDGVIANFEHGHQQACQDRGNPTAYEGRDRKIWDILDLDVGADQFRAICLEMWHAPGFFSRLQPIPEGLAVMGHWQHVMKENVFICTAPLLHSEHCVKEKIAWVRKYLGDEWTRRVIVSPDKTLVRGDIIIDDKPYIHGAMAPVWRHLVYRTFYNELEAVDKPRFSWDTWERDLSNARSHL